jgi:ribonuclease HI
MIEVYTDGSCLGNPGNGGWAFLVKKKEIISSRSGFVVNTTNNQMELTAAIKAIEFIYTSDAISLFTDNNWKNSSKQPVKNKKLWERLDELNSIKSVKWEWVKAHDTNIYNNQVDLLARQSAENLTESSFDGV